SRALGLLVTPDAATRDDFRGQHGNPPTSPVLGGAMEDDAQIGVAARDHVREPEAELVAATVATNDPRMVATIATDRVVEIGNDTAMRIIRHFAHFEYSS